MDPTTLYAKVNNVKPKCISLKEMFSNYYTDQPHKIADCWRSAAMACSCDNMIFRFALGRGKPDDFDDCPELTEDDTNNGGGGFQRRTTLPADDYYDSGSFDSSPDRFPGSEARILN